MNATDKEKLEELFKKTITSNYMYGQAWGEHCETLRAGNTVEQTRVQAQKDNENFLEWLNSIPTE